VDQNARQQWRGVRLLVPSASHGRTDGRLDVAPLPFPISAKKTRFYKQTSYEQKTTIKKHHHSPRVARLVWPN